MTDKLRRKIKILRKKRDDLRQEFCRLPRRNSFSGLGLSAQLDEVQEQLDSLEGKRRSKRYCAETDIEIIG